MVKGGATYVTQPGASAHYAYGALTGVTATATGPDTIDIQGCRSILCQTLTYTRM